MDQKVLEEETKSISDAVDDKVTEEGCEYNPPAVATVWGRILDQYVWILIIAIVTDQEWLTC